MAGSNAIHPFGPAKPKAPLIGPEAARAKASCRPSCKCNRHLPRFRAGWRGWVDRPQTPAEEKSLRRCLNESRSYGDDQWLILMKKKLGWREPLKRGRPRKQGKWGCGLENSGSSRLIFAMQVVGKSGFSRVVAADFSPRRKSWESDRDPARPLIPSQEATKWRKNTSPQEVMSHLYINRLYDIIFSS